MAQKSALPSILGRGGSGGIDDSSDDEWVGVFPVEGLSEVKDVGVGAGASGGGTEADSDLTVVFSARNETGSPKRLGFFKAASLNLPFSSGLLV